ncbi:phage tail protein [Pseudomonas sp. LS2P72]
MDYPNSVPSAGLVNGKFVDENPLMGTPGSLIPADWGNGVTEEIVNVIRAGDLTPDETNYKQLLQAIQSISAKGWNLDSALPIGSLPPPTVATADGRLPVTSSAVATMGGKVSVPAGVLISIGQEVVAGQLGRTRTFTTQAWSTDLSPSTWYFLRAHVVAGVLKFYAQRGSLYDVAPASLKGTPDAVAGGGFQSTPLDMCVAWIITGAPGTVPSVFGIYNRSRLSWTQTVNGTGVVYLPLDPHARSARLIVGNPSPSPTDISGVSFASAGWVGGNYCFLSPALTTSSNHDAGWTSPIPCTIFTNNYVNDVTVTTLTASFDHSQLRSLWQSYQAEHMLGSTSAVSDELLFSMGIKNHPVAEYASGIAVNFSAAINISFSWELIR